MNLFESVKASVSVREAAAMYGIKVDRNNMCVCPFHQDRRPSMKVDGKYLSWFFCFGCGEKGDVISFVEKLFGLSPLDAVKKLAEDFNVSYDSTHGDYERKKSPEEIRREQEYAEAKKFAVRKRDLCLKIMSLRSKLHDVKWSAEDEAMELLSSKPGYREAVDVIGHIDDILDKIYDGTDEELKKVIDGMERTVDSYGREFIKISGGGN